MFATDVSPIVVDIETAGLPNAADFLEPVQAARNLKDEAKIKADIEARTAERNEKLALDWNVGRIAAIGWWMKDCSIRVECCRDEDHEANALIDFWMNARGRPIVGFNIRGFDLKFMVQRSRYLGVTYPYLDFSKYSQKGIWDLYLLLTFGDGTYDQGCMRRTLRAFCTRFGIPVNDTVQGKDVPALVAAGDWDAVRDHVISDVTLTVALARRLGVIQSVPIPEAVAV